MGDVIFFEVDNPSSFTISATIDGNDAWNVSIDKFYNSQMPISEVYREVAEALIPIAGGLIQEAERVEPTKRGGLIVNIAIYESGFIDFNTLPFDTAERLDWFLSGLEALKTMATESFERQTASDKP